MSIEKQKIKIGHLIISFILKNKLPIKFNKAFCRHFALSVINNRIIQLKRDFTNPSESI